MTAKKSINPSQREQAMELARQKCERASIHLNGAIWHGGNVGFGVKVGVPSDEGRRYFALNEACEARILWDDNEKRLVVALELE